MKVTDFYNEVSRLADTDKTQINAAEVKRVLSVGFMIMSRLSAVELTDLIAKGIALGAKKTDDKKEAKSEAPAEG